MLRLARKCRYQLCGARHLRFVQQAAPDLHQHHTQRITPVRLSSRAHAVHRGSLFQSRQFRKAGRTTLTISILRFFPQIRRREFRHAMANTGVIDHSRNHLLRLSNCTAEIGRRRSVGVRQAWLYDPWRLRRLNSHAMRSGKGSLHPGLRRRKEEPKASGDQ